MNLTIEQIGEKYKEFKLIDNIENMYGGCGTYSLNINIYESSGDLLRVTSEKKTGPAIKPGQFRADDIYLRTIEIVEKVGDNWKAIETLFHIEERYNKYDDGDTRVEILT